MSTPYPKLSTPSIPSIEDPPSSVALPAIASTCLMCGGGFTDEDLQQLEWPVSDSPAHRACYLQYVDERNQWSDMIEEMRGA